MSLEKADLTWTAGGDLAAGSVAIEAMDCYLAVEFGNQGSRTHEYGTRARQAVWSAHGIRWRLVVAARRSEVIFTSGATEANNLAILGLAESAGRGHILSTQIEHPAALEPIVELERRGFEVTRVAPTTGGWVDAAEVLRAARTDTFLVSVMQVNNETGVQQPIAEIAEGLAGSAARLHVDAAQGFGKILAPLRHPRIDLISASAHKIGGPQGVGALIARRRESGWGLRPLMFGGGQERGLRPGTLPAHLIAGFGMAAELAVSEAPERWCRAAEFRARVLAGLAGTDFVVNGDLDRMSPYILNVSFRGFDSDQVMEAWTELAAVSNGSACASQQITCSHVLAAMGIDEKRAAGAVRISWCSATPLPDFAAMTGSLSESIPAGTHGRIA